MQNVKDILISLIRCAITGEETDGIRETDLTNDVLSSLLALSSKNDVSQIIADMLIKHNLVADEEMKEIFKLSAKNALMRTEKIAFEYRTICDLFENNAISYMPLKGSVIRNLYPKDWYRTSCDIDILIKKEDVKRAVSLVTESLEYTLHEEKSHDIGFYTKSGLHIELHFSLIEDKSLHLGDKRRWNADCLEGVWQSARVKDGTKYHYIMDADLFYIYHMAHMAKHFEGGGCGVRSIIDLYLINRDMKSESDNKEALLKECKLREFSDSLCDLSNAWFESGKYTDILYSLEEYIVTGGVYGSSENNFLYKKDKKGGKFRYIMYRIFMPYDVLKYIYPTLKKYKWLYPFYTVRRWFERLLFGGRMKKSIKELSFNDTDNPDREKMNEMIEKIGL